MKKLGLIAIWVLATSLATLATVAAVRLVGSSVTDQPTTTTALAAGDPSTTTTAVGDTSVTTSRNADGSTTTSFTLPGSTTGTASTGATSATTGATTATTAPRSTTSTTTGATTTTTTTSAGGSTTTTTTAGGSTTTTTGATTTTTTAPAPVTGPFVYSSIGGSVTVTCQGDNVALSGAVPASGYTAEVEESGPDRVRVEFKGSDAESEIRVECDNGVPDPEISEK